MTSAVQRSSSHSTPNTPDHSMATAIQEVTDQIEQAKAELEASARRLRRLYRTLLQLRKRAGITRSADEIAEEMRQVRAQFSDLARNPGKANQFRLMRLASKLGCLEAELRGTSDQDK